MTCTGLKGRCFLELKSVLLEVSYIEKWPKFAYLELKVPHLKFWVMQDRVYMGQLGLAYSWIPRREIEPQLIVAPSVSSKACPLCIYHWLTLPGGRLRRGNQGFTLGHFQVQVSQNHQMLQNRKMTREKQLKDMKEANSHQLSTSSWKQ